MSQLHRKLTIVGAIAALLAASVAAPPAASAAVNYSPLYWELLDRYASAELPVEYTGAPYRGIYYGNPASPVVCEEACGEMIALYVLNPDGVFRPWGTWIEDPAAPDGWRGVTSSDCEAVGWLDFAHPNWWVCWGVGYL
jgi:hypothetical protein